MKRALPMTADRRKHLVVVADGNPNIRSALRLLVNQQSDFEVVAEPVDAVGLMDCVTNLPVNVAVLDWGLPGLHESAVLDGLRVGFPHVLVIVLSARPELRGEALSAGAHAFVSKIDGPASLFATLNEAIAGQAPRR